MIDLRSYVCGRWVEGAPSETLLNPATEEPLARGGSGGIDRAGVLDYARTKGGPALQSLTFAQRGALLRGMCDAIQAIREELLDLSVANGGNTRGDAKFDVDGATHTLASYAELGQSLGQTRFIVDGEGVALGRSPRFYGQHFLVPRSGVAVQINAFNFPAWGLAEKAAVALLAGMPVVSKPATSSAIVAHRIMQALVEKTVLPEGSLSFLVGEAGDLLQHVGVQDVVAFTGSGTTGAKIRSLPRIILGSVRLNIEADSLNAAVLGPDVEPDSETYSLFLKDVLRDMTQKAGQKCTAIRRILVPRTLAARLRDDLADRLKAIVVGNPAQEGVRMGPLATSAQLKDVRNGVGRLAAEGRLIVGNASTPPPGVGDKGFFISPILLEVDSGAQAPSVHSHEVFGPVATIVPYSGAHTEAAEIVCLGQGALVSSLYSEDLSFTTDLAMALAPYHGRLFLGSCKIAEQSPGPGTVLPQLVHGGPGRAGGGEELGGARGLSFYLQRVALEGSRPSIERIAERGAH